MQIRLAIFCLLGLSMGILPASAHEESKETSKPEAQVQKMRGPDEETTRNYFTDLALLNQEGKRVRFYTDVLKDRVVMLSFIYTTCKDACPLLMHKLTQVKDGLGEIFGKQVFFVSMSVDPARDTPKALAKYAKQQKAEHPGWVFLTGDKQNIDTILRKLGQYSATPEAHSTLLLAGNVKTRHWAKISPVSPPEAIVLKLQDLASESSSVDAMLPTSAREKK